MTLQIDFWQLLGLLLSGLGALWGVVKMAAAQADGRGLHDHAGKGEQHADLPGARLLEDEQPQVEGRGEQVGEHADAEEL